MINKESACLWKTDYFSLNTINYNVNKCVDECLFGVWKIVDNFGGTPFRPIYPQSSTVLLDEAITA